MKIKAKNNRVINNKLQINHMMEDNDKENLLTNEPDEETQSLPEEANEEKRDDKVNISCI